MTNKEQLEEIIRNLEVIQEYFGPSVKETSPEISHYFIYIKNKDGKVGKITWDEMKLLFAWARLGADNIRIDLSKFMGKKLLKSDVLWAGG